MVSIIAEITDIIDRTLIYKIKDVESVERLTKAGSEFKGCNYDQIYTIAYPKYYDGLEVSEGDVVVIKLDLKLCPYTLEVEANYTKAYRYEDTVNSIKAGKVGNNVRGSHGSCIEC